MARRLLTSSLKALRGSAKAVGPTNVDPSGLAQLIRHVMIFIVYVQVVSEQGDLAPDEIHSSVTVHMAHSQAPRLVSIAMYAVMDARKLSLLNYIGFPSGHRLIYVLASSCFIIQRIQGATIENRLFYSRLLQLEGAPLRTKFEAPSAPGKFT